MRDFCYWVLVPLGIAISAFAAVNLIGFGVVSWRGDPFGLIGYFFNNVIAPAMSAAAVVGGYKLFKRDTNFYLGWVSIFGIFAFTLFLVNAAYTLREGF